MSPNLLDTIGSSSSVWMFSLVVLAFGAIVAMFVVSFVKKLIAAQDEEDKDKHDKMVRRLWFVTCIELVILFWAMWIVFSAFGPGHRPIDTVPEDEGLDSMFDYVVQPTQEEVDAINKKDRPKLMDEMDEIGEKNVDIDAEMSKALDRAVKAQGGKAER